MHFKFYGKNVDFTPSMEAKTEKKISGLSKYFGETENISSTVSLEIARDAQIVTITLNVNGKSYTAKAGMPDFYASVDACVGKLKHQLESAKSKQQARKLSTAQACAFNQKDWDKAKKLALRQFGMDEGVVCFDCDGVCIVDPWIDETGRFELSDEEAIERYGLETIEQFVTDLLKAEVSQC